MNKLGSASEYKQRDVRQSQQCYLRGDEQSGSAAQTDGEQTKPHRLHGTEGYEVQISEETVTLVHKGVDPLEIHKLPKESVYEREQVEEDDDCLLSEVMQMRIG